jgi:squalene-hopene/tetraprenyl-beta-curcumene cyclase
MIRTTAAVLAALLAMFGMMAMPAAAAPQQQQIADRAREVARQMAICPVKANPAQLDAGLVRPNTDVKFEAVLLNTLDRPVTCVRSSPSCTCTTVDMLGKVIPAGGTLTVPLSMRTSGATGEKTAQVVLMFKDVPGLVELGIRAEVTYPVRAFQMNPGPDGKPRRDPFINAYDIKSNVAGEVTVESIDGAPFRVLSVGGQPAQFVDFDPVNQGPRESYRVRYDFSRLPCDQVPKYLVIETDRADARLIDLRVRHECTRINPAFSFAQFRENLGVLAPGETRMFEFEIKHANGVRIDAVNSTDPRLDSRIVGQKPGAEDGLLVTVAVTAKADASGLVLAPLRFVGVGPDPKRPVPPGQPVATTPRESDFLVYAKIERAAPKLEAKPVSQAEIAVPDAVRTAVLAPPAPAMDARIKADRITRLGDPSVPGRVLRPLPVVMRIADRAEEVPMDPARFAAARAAVTKGLDYLRTTQGPDGGWMQGSAAKATDQAAPSTAVPSAVTGLALKAFAQAGFTGKSDAAARKALDYVVARTMVGGEFRPDQSGGLANYVASMVLMGLAAQQDDSLVRPVEAIRTWLVRNQWDQEEGIGPNADWFGGAGYGNHGRPDLSNTQLMLDALHDAGVSTDDPAVQRALVFVARTQNTKANDATWAQKGSGDGGFVYTPSNGGESFASDAAGEGRYGEKMPEGTRSLRSYGSMTYAGFKSLLYAGLSKDDPRVTAAWDWIRRNYTFAENPGLGQQGRYYYLHAAARAMFAANTASVVPLDAKASGEGAPRNWRNDLVDALLGTQREDGSWVNGADRWQEGQPELVTAYAVLALEEALKPVTQGD